MKNYPFTPFIVIIVFCFLFLNQADAQESWETPQAITDSITDNINPNLVRTDHYTLIFYEKINQENQSSIYMQDFRFLHDEIALFSEEGIHFRNPQILDLNPFKDKDDLEFILLLESDMENDGIFNIYYCEYSEENGFSELMPLTSYTTSTNHLRARKHSVAWERNGHIEYCFYMGNSFTDIQTLDSIDCSNPEIGNGSIAYQKLQNDSLGIYYAEFVYGMRDWSVPEQISSNSEENSINILYDGFTSEWDVGLIFESYYDDQYHLLAYHEDNDTLEYTENTSMQASALYHDIAIGDYDFIEVSYLAIRKQEDENAEIYINSIWSSNDLLNISNSEFEESNPQLYFYYNYSYNTILFWQSTRNNHQQLFLTKQTFFVGLDEDSSQSETIIYPNPSSSNINIVLKPENYENLTIDLFDIHQKQLSRLYESNNLTQDRILLELPKELANGVYFLRLKSKTNLETHQIIISR